MIGFVKTLHLHTSKFTILGTHNLTSSKDTILKFSRYKAMLGQY